ncbi:MAG: hypothetical protein RDU20_15755 [Desulfomonilaceae bacterium]|nr:hypothetical protein [Desulfomonilaceae bacterium]
MSKEEIQRLIDSMAPGDAAELLADSARKLFTALDEEERRGFLINLIEGADRESEAGLVHF